MNFLTTNARSLTPKITSLLDNMCELDLHFAAVTETWLQSGQTLRGDLIDLEFGSGVKVIYKNRKQPKGSRAATGGGVALLYNCATCSFKERKMRGNKFEAVCAVGKIGKIKNPVVVYVAYLPPRLRAAELVEFNEVIAQSVVEVSTKLVDPVFVFAGDVNHRDVSPAFDLVDDMIKLETGPTRGDNTLDVVYTNVNVHAIKVQSSVKPPLESEAGQLSDHGCVLVESRFQKHRDFTWITKTTRKRSDQADQAYCEELREVQWEDKLGQVEDVNAMLAVMVEVMDTLMEKHYPLVKSRRRSNEKPWITNAIRRRSKRKKRLFRKNGRSAKWRRSRDDIQEEVENKKNEYLDSLIEAGNGGKDFFAAVKQMTTVSTKKAWSVMDLFPDDTEATACEEVLRYFGNLAGCEGDSGALGPVPRNAQPIDLPRFTIESTTELLRNIKKTDSRVEGDPFPHLVRKDPAAFAAPVSMIFNQICAQSDWPKAWKEENLTIIPKCRSPESLSQCRNISCTSLFSKVLEGVVMRHLRTELVEDLDQYGGVPGCGAEHLLIDLWEKTLSSMDDGNTAVAILGVDFEKAFNRVRHDTCIDMLQKLGASSGSINLIHSFLHGRTMRIRIGNTQSEPRPIDRGSPQGSVLGCMLYCVATQWITKQRPGDDFQMAPDRPRPRAPSIERGAGMARIPEEGANPILMEETESGTSDDDSFLSAHSVIIDTDEDEEGGVIVEEPTSFKYIDDTTVVQPVCLVDAIRHISAGPPVEIVRPMHLERKLTAIVNNAKEIDMKVNCNKTQLLCIGNNNGYHTGAIITGDEGDIASVDDMKLLGFHFGVDPNASRHVKHIRDGFRARIWMMFHLRTSGLKGKKLHRLYCSLVRSSVEYLSPVYHALLGAGQAEQLERLNRHAVRISFGSERPVGEIMEEHSIETLCERRMRRIKSFTVKSSNNPRFRDRWFPRRAPDTHGLRRRRNVIEPKARTSRYHNSPLNFMRRLANDMGLFD